MSPIAPHPLGKFEQLVACAAPLFAIALGACSYEPHHDHYDPPPPPPSPYFDLWEAEPNDAACCPDAIGQLWVGDSLVIGGNITELGPDIFDGFAFQNVQPCDIEFELVPIYAGADLDLCVYDPMLGDFAFCFETGNAIESGRFSVPSAFTDFHLVLSSFAYASEYRLYVYCVPITYGALSPASEQTRRAERAVPLERYFDDGAIAGEEPDEERVIAKGELFEIDQTTGAIREWPVQVLGIRPEATDRPRSERLIRREN